MMPAPSARPHRRQSSCARLSDDELLDLRFCDLDLRIEGTPLEERVRQLYQELESKGIRFRPHCWISDEWFAPHETPGIAIPFYLAHPRLAKLEDRMMLEVEGGTKGSCRQLLRHEAGHSLETAYHLSRRARWRRLFGRASRPYPEYYRPRPFSRHYVHHLDWWYAQSHPTEDFAETFAVWLQPRSQWRKRYRDWPALRKLEYVDELMAEIAGLPIPRTSRAEVDPIHRLRYTLRDHYASRQRRYEADYPDFYDRDLRRLFSEGSGHDNHMTAATFLRRSGPQLRKLVASWTGEYPYTINLALKEMIARCRELDLWVSRPADKLKLDLAVVLTMHTMSFVYSSDHRIAL